MREKKQHQKRLDEGKHLIEELKETGDKIQAIVGSPNGYRRRFLERMQAK